jgi:hypothetical protein
LALPAQADQENGKKWHIELFGGYSTLNPADLNKRPEFDELFEDYYTEQRYGYYHSNYGDFVTYTGQVNGEFNKIKSAFPIGFRLKYQLNPDLSISVGIKYLANKQTSQVSHRYDIISVNPDGVQFYDEFTLTRENNPYSLSVKAYVPMVGVHYRLWENRSIHLEGYLAAGPLFAQCDHMRQRIASSVDSYEYTTTTESSFEMEGSGTGIAVDLGVQIKLRMVQSIHLLVESGYSLQVASNISGPGSVETKTWDSNSEGYTESDTWDGSWAMVESSFNREWGTVRYAFPTNQYGTQGLSDFKLNLSGFQIRVGISLDL